MKDFKEQIAKPRRVALYASLTIPDSVFAKEVYYTTFDEHYCPLPEGERRELSSEGYVRITEPVAVQFTAIDNDTMVRNAVEALNAEERKTLDELNTKLAEIRERKSQLLALTHQTDAS